MTRTSTAKLSSVALSVGLSVALALPTVFVPVQAWAQGPDDPATAAPIVIVTTPAPAPPPAPVYVAAEPITNAPSPMLVNPEIAAMKHRRNSGIGMTVAGFTMFGTSYLISALVGTISLDYARDVGGSGTYGTRMLIPLVGPFMAIPRADSATGGLFTGLLGVFQLGSVVLGTAGAIRLGRANRDLRMSANSGGLTLQF